MPVYCGIPVCASLTDEYSEMTNMAICGSALDSHRHTRQAKDSMKGLIESFSREYVSKLLLPSDHA
jgi:hypothetical protein